MYCCQCGAKLGENGKFCPECGAKQPERAEEKRVCSYCGGELTAGAGFCSYCGRSVSEERTAPERTVPPPEPPRSASWSNTPRPAAPRPSAPAPSRSYTQTPRQSGPMRSSTRRQPEPSQKTKKKGGCLRRFLLLLLIIGVAYFGFRDGGFLRGKGQDGNVYPPFHTNQGGSSGSSGSSSGGSGSGTSSGGSGGQSAAGVSNGPADTEDLTIHYSDAELAAAPAVSASVSREKPVAVCGDIRVDFKSWNLPEGEDTLTVRSLGSKTDEAAGWTLETYDFSLASGTHEFYTNVEITFPKPEDEDSTLTDFICFNEATGRWEDLYSRVSEDGSSYLVYIKHFSPVAKKKILFLEAQPAYMKPQEQNVFSESGVDAELFVELFEGEGLGKVYSSSRIDSSNRMLAQVRLDYDRFWYMAEQGKLDRVQQVVDQFAGNAITVNELMDKLAKLDDKSMLQELFETAHNVGPGMLDASMVEIPDGPVKTYLGCVGAALGWADVMAAYTRITCDAKLREKTIAQSILEDHKMDLINGVSGAVGTVTSVLSVLGYELPTPVTAALAAASLTLYAAGQMQESFEASFQGSKVIEYTYQAYVDQPAVFYGYNDMTTQTAHGYCLMMPLTTLNDDQYQELAAFIYAHPLGCGWENTGSDGELVKDPTWVPVMIKILDICKDTPEIIPSVVEELLNHRAGFWFGMTETERQDFYYDWRRGKPFNAELDAEYVDPSSGDQQGLAALERARLRTWAAWAAQQAEESLVKDARKETETFLNKTLVPLLNKQMVFHVQDKNAEKFRTSTYCHDIYEYPYNELWKLSADDVYNEELGPTVVDYRDSDILLPMYFDGVGEPLFFPIAQDSPAFNAKKPNEVKRVGSLEYYPFADNFLPRANAYHGYDEDDVVFKCTIYHYLMMGAPTHMVFQEYPSEALTPVKAGEEPKHYSPNTVVTVDFSGPECAAERSGQIHITIPAESGFSQGYFVGSWRLGGGVEVQLGYNFTSATWTYSESSGDDWATMIYGKYKIDVAKKTLTIYEPEYIYQGKGPDKLVFSYVDENTMEVYAGGSSATLHRITWEDEED